MSPLLSLALTLRLKSLRYTVTPSTSGSARATTSTESLNRIPLALNSEMVVASEALRAARSVAALRGEGGVQGGDANDETGEDETTIATRGEKEKERTPGTTRSSDRPPRSRSAPVRRRGVREDRRRESRDRRGRAPARRRRRREVRAVAGRRPLGGVAGADVADDARRLARGARARRRRRAEMPPGSASARGGASASMSGETGDERRARVDASSRSPSRADEHPRQH